MARPAFSRIRMIMFTAGNGAAARTCTGAVWGDRVVAVINHTDLTPVAATVFESKVTVNDQIQQLTTNLTAKVCTVLLVGRGNPRI